MFNLRIGGTVIVNGPTMNGNGSLDYDGTFEMTGGFLVSAGSSGMVQAASEQSKQYGVLMNYTQSQKAGTMLHLKDADGNTIITFSPSKNYQENIKAERKLWTSKLQIA